jgi:hypothetical protein
MLSSGQVSVKPVRAELYRDMDPFGKMDPYCIVNCGTQQQRSATAKNGGKSPVFYETFIFNLSNNEQLIQFNLYDDDPGKDDYLGGGQINISQISQSGGSVAPWIDLIGKTGTLAGRLLVELKLTQGKSSYGTTGGMMPTTQMGYQQPMMQQQPMQQQPMMQQQPLQQQMPLYGQQQMGYQQPSLYPQTTQMGYGMQKPMMQQPMMQQPLQQQMPLYGQQQPMMQQQPGMYPQQGMQQPGYQGPYY